MADKVLDTILLLALPASGKSEVRRYLELLSPADRSKDFHMGPNVQFDDFPYVHVMRRIDDELAARRKGRIFFNSSDKPFQNPRDWGTLTALLNDDYQDLLSAKTAAPASAAEHLCDRIDAAHSAVGGAERLKLLDAATRKGVSTALEKECRDLLDERRSIQGLDLTGKTVVIEFARGGPHGSPLPLPEFYGYRYSLSQLSDAILRKAVILYIWVTPEESRRKNEARNDPKDPGSILHHGVPLEVMLNDYGCDDFEWLESEADKPGTVTVEAHGKKYSIPFARFDNRVDKTSFLREDQKLWKPADVKAVHDGMKGALDKLAGLAAAV